MCVPGRSVVGMDASQAHPLSLDEEQAHLQLHHISLSSHPLSVIHKDKNTFLTHSDTRCVGRFICTCSYRFSPNSASFFFFCRSAPVSLPHGNKICAILSIWPE